MVLHTVFQNEVEDEDEIFEVPVKALIVDDSNLDRLILQKLLMKKGYDVYSAYDGTMGIEIFNECQPDIVFMDLYLPDATGYEVTQQIRQNTNGKYIPIIFVTGATDDTALEKCLESGGDDFIVKPIKESLLNAKVGAMLRIKNMHDDVLEKKYCMQVYMDTQIKDLQDADKVIYNIHSPQFYNPSNLSWSYLPQNILSGDIICSAMGPSGNHVILVGDNTGHGLPAAIGSIITSDTFYSMVAKGFSISQIIFEVNKKLQVLLPVDRFLAACFIEINEEYETATIWNAGMPDVVITDAEGNCKKRICSSHMALGIIPITDNTLNLQNIKMESGEYIYAYTDGLIEAFNKEGDFYGEDKLLKAIASASNETKRVDFIIDDMHKFTEHADQNDDVLLLEVAFNKPESNVRKKCDLNYVEFKPGSWQLNLEMGADSLRAVNPVPVIMQAMVDLQGFGRHREKLFLIMTEMFSNALEHGILELDSSMKQDADGFINYYKQRESRLDVLEDAKLSISINNRSERGKGVLSISIEDSGDGFDYESFEINLAENRGVSGRGIALIKDLCRSTIYTNKGNKLDVEYEWQNEYD